MAVWVECLTDQLLDVVKTIEHPLRSHTDVVDIHERCLYGARANLAKVVLNRFVLMTNVHAGVACDSVLPRLDIDLNDPESFAQGKHHEMLSLLRNDQPVYWHEETDGPGYWCLTKHADVVVASRDTKTFSSAAQGVRIRGWDEDPTPGANWLRKWMITLDPPRHTQSRALVNKGFTTSSINRLEPQLRDRARTIVSELDGRDRCDIVADFASQLPLIAIADLMGVPEGDRDELFQSSDALVAAEVANPEGSVESQARQAEIAGAGLIGYAKSLCELKRTCPAGDIASDLLRIEDGGQQLTDEDFERLVLILFTGAGFETTRLTTIAGVHAFLENPDQLDKLRRDPTLVDRAVEEMLRWATPVAHFRRTAMCDVEIRGQQIRSGDKVVLWYSSANRDEDVFDEPFQFDIERSPNPHLSLGGGGPHYCLGANLARLELKILLEEMITLVPRLELAGEVERIRSNFATGIARMPVRFTSQAQRATERPGS